MKKLAVMLLSVLMFSGCGVNGESDEQKEERLAFSDQLQMVADDLHVLESEVILMSEEREEELLKSVVDLQDSFLVLRELMDEDESMVLWRENNFALASSLDLLMESFVTGQNLGSEEGVGGYIEVIRSQIEDVKQEMKVSKFLLVHSEGYRYVR